MPTLCQRWLWFSGLSFVLTDFACMEGVPGRRLWGWDVECGARGVGWRGLFVED